MGRDMGRVAHVVRVDLLLHSVLSARLEIPRLCRGDSSIFKIGKLPVKPLGEVVYQPENNGTASEWTANLNLVR